LGLTLAKTTLELFASQGMGEDALRLLTHEWKRHKRIRAEVKAVLSGVRTAAVWARHL